VRTAYARGKRHPAVVVTEMLPNALLPILTMAGLNLAGLLGGTVIVEQVFAWPGLGEVLIGAVSNRDFAVVQAGLLVIAIIFIMVNVVVDVLYSVLDPRVKFS
jgi:peptide/nickel transport system permease protein